jgi:hypothetical protein
MLCNFEQYTPRFSVVNCKFVISEVFDRRFCIYEAFGVSVSQTLASDIRHLCHSNKYNSSYRVGLSDCPWNSSAFATNDLLQEDIPSHFLQVPLF